MGVKVQTIHPFVFHNSASRLSEGYSFEIATLCYAPDHLSRPLSQLGAISESRRAAILVAARPKFVEFPT